MGVTSVNLIWPSICYRRLQCQRASEHVLSVDKKVGVHIMGVEIILELIFLKYCIIIKYFCHIILFKM